MTDAVKSGQIETLEIDARGRATRPLMQRLEYGTCCGFNSCCIDEYSCCDCIRFAVWIFVAGLCGFVSNLIDEGRNFTKIYLPFRTNLNIFSLETQDSSCFFFQRSTTFSMLSSILHCHLLVMLTLLGAIVFARPVTDDSTTTSSSSSSSIRPRPLSTAAMSSPIQVQFEEQATEDSKSSEPVFSDPRHVVLSDCMISPKF